MFIVHMTIVHMGLSIPHQHVAPAHRTRRHAWAHARYTQVYAGEDFASATRHIRQYSTMNMFTGNNDHSEIRVQNRLQAHSADWSEYVREKLDQFAWQQ